MSRQRIRGPSIAKAATVAVWAKHASAAKGMTLAVTEMMRSARVFMPSHDGNVPSNARPTDVVGRHLTLLLPPPRIVSP